MFRIEVVNSKPLFLSKELSGSLNRFFLAIIILLISHDFVISQECIEYPEIDGTPCIFCVPTGWTAINSPDIGSFGGGPSGCVVNMGVSGPSPSGNNFVSLATTNSSYFEGMSTVINNLTPCQSYTFGIWWEETIWCNVWNNPGTLLITVQGEQFIFSGATTWELAQVCFTAQSTSVEISVAVFADGGQHSIIVDGSPACSELSPCSAPEPCCTLVVTADDTHEICPGTAINLNGLAQMPTGNVQVEWTSVPANGVTFLSDPNILNPVFTFPAGDFGGETFNFLLTVTDDVCTKTKEVEVKVLKSEMPTFDFSVCELADPSIFPNESLNGYEGIWTGNFNFKALAGTFETYTFSLASNEENCIRNADFDIEIIEADNPIFDLPTSFCADDNELFVLPKVSQNFINGSWNLNEFTPADLGVGIFDFQFTPESQFCALPYNYRISLSMRPTFETLLCASKEAIVLDPISNNGIVGLWNPPVINPEDVINNEFVSTWNPTDPSSACVTDLQVTFVLEQPATLSFDLEDSLCLNTGIYNLPSKSLEAISGQWNIPNINTNLLPEGNIDLTFTSSEFCVQDFQTSIELKAQKVPIFDIKTDLCKSASAYILPSTSLDGITGSWSQPIIDPSIINSGFISTFTPSSIYQSCYLPVNVVFQISSKIIPTFDLPTAVCVTDAPLVFPTISKNGISGSWSTIIIDFSLINASSVKNTFIPTNTDCEESLEVTIDIVKLEKPTIVTNNPSDCNKADGSIILTGSVSDYEFSMDGKLWQSNTTFDNLPSGRFIIYQRSILNTSCIDSMMVDIFSPSNPIILTLDVSDVTNCKVKNGKLICTAEGENLEYSINGLPWQSSPVFENLGPGNYTIQVRNGNKVSCITQSTFDIEDVENTLIVGLQTTAITDCGKEDGKVIISATGENLAYSIDGGQNFFVSPEFINLSAGQYNIVVQSTSNLDCNVDTIIVIDAPLAPSDLVIVKDDISACGKEDGSIKISAKGNALEYSINGGLTWSTDSIFNGLSAKEYLVVVREINKVNCRVNGSIILNATDAPKLTNQTILQPTTCISNDGIITLEINALDVEYSIDGGTNWQKSNKFTDLSQGNYNIIFRKLNTLFCEGEVTFDIINPPCPCNDLSVVFSVGKVSCKDMSTGQISIDNIAGFTVSDTINFMWENSSRDFKLANLAEGWYSYTINYDKNCSLEDSIFVGTFDPIDFGLLGFDVTCNSLGSIKVYDLFGGSGQFQFSKDALNYQEDNTFFNLTAKEYEVIVKDILGCNEVDKISIGKEGNLSLTLPIIKPIRKGTSIILNPLINQSTIDSFIWTPKKYILNPGKLIAEVAPPVTTEYLLTIYFGDCSETRSVLIEVIGNDNLYIPNIISLKSKDNNGKFYFFGSLDNSIEIDYYKFFDRWGNLVYQINNPQINNADDGWDGTLNGRNVEQGVYIYTSVLKVNGEKKMISGSITVVR
jgi:hypothetical protein